MSKPNYFEFMVSSYIHDAEKDTYAQVSQITGKGSTPQEALADVEFSQIRAINRLHELVAQGEDDLSRLQALLGSVGAKEADSS